MTEQEKPDTTGTGSEGHVPAAERMARRAAG